EDLALHVHGDFATQVAARHRGRHLSDITYLTRQVRRHRVHVVRQVFPRPGNARHDGLSTEFTHRADFARHTCHLGSERAQLLDHGVDSLFELQNLTAYVHGDLLGEIPRRDGDGDLRDVAHLRGEVASHLVDGFGELLPDPGDALHLRLTPEFTFCTHLPRHARHLGSKHRELLYHAVYQPSRPQKLAFERTTIGLECHGLTEIFLGYRADGTRHLGGRQHEVRHQRIERVNLVRPSTNRP